MGDNESYGRLVFVFCAGLSCMSSVWLGSKEHPSKSSRLFPKKTKTVTMKSGDCMIFEGQTPNKVHELIPGTSPFPQGDWLEKRRMSILVRQNSDVSCGVESAMYSCVLEA